MISIMLHSHPETGQDTRFTIHECQRGDDPRTAVWDRDVIQHYYGMEITVDSSEVTTLDAVREWMDFENATTDFILRALGWSEIDLSDLWDEHRERTV